MVANEARDAHGQVPKISPGMPVLMLGGVRDEVVPRSQMQELWEIIRNRGRDTATSTRSRKPPAGVKGAAVEDDEDESEKKGVTGSGSPRPRPGPGPGPGSRSNGRSKVPPRVVVDGGNRYIEFANGTHSEYSIA